MVKRIGSRMRKIRHKYTVGCRQKGKISVSKYLQEFNTGDAVNLVITPNVQEGQFFRRFYGSGGIVTGKKGECYEITFNDGNKEKKLYVHPIHLQKQ